MDSFNWSMSYNFSSLLSLPSRLVARIRRIDDILLHDDPMEESAITTAAMTSSLSTMAGGPSHRATVASAMAQYDMTLPGPWRFLTSGYFLSLLAMALLLNRIHHTVVPPGPSFLYRMVRSRRSIYQAVIYSIFPIDLSSTKSRFVLRLPSLFLLFRALITLTVILLQTSGLLPSWNFQFLHIISKWANSKSMDEVCWSAFGAVCTALAVGALTRGLEGDMSQNTSPFNLFGYAFLLHMYSMPVTHTNKGPPSRPDKHVIVTIILPLLQLTILHFLGIKRTWSRQRLIPTTVCSILTLLHFHAVVWSSHPTYPVLNYLPCLLESLLLSVTLLTILLNVLTQVLLTGQIRQPLLGHTGRLMPKWDEDFPVVLLRLGTASLDATSIVGLGNEVGVVTAGFTLVSQKGPSLDDGVVELSRGGVVSMIPSRKGKKTARGFANEIKTVKPSAVETEWLFDSLWYKELGKFGLALVGAIRGIALFFIRLIWCKLLNLFSSRQPSSKAGDNDDTSQDKMTFEIPPESNTESAYRRFLLGESVSDDEDEYEPPSSSRSETVTAESSTGSDNEDNAQDNAELSERVALYSDLMEPSSSTSAPLLLAHMTTLSSSPLTRRRYNQLVVEGQGRVSSTSTPPNEWSSFVVDRRIAANTRMMEFDEDSAASRRNCVICTVEPRDIICWPCRCLALCDDCRLNLASRFSASKHTCPCCRRTVEGYSKVFIP